jgi:hypothetical protein
MSKLDIIEQHQGWKVGGVRVIFDSYGSKENEFAWRIEI